MEHHISSVHEADQEEKKAERRRSSSNPKTWLQHARSAIRGKGKGQSSFVQGSKENISSPERNTETFPAFDQSQEGTSLVRSIENIDATNLVREIRLRCFRKDQRAKINRDNWPNAWNFDIVRGNDVAHGGNCLADASLFDDAHGPRLLGDDDTEHYKKIYGFQPDEVKALENDAMLVDAINKAGTLHFKYGYSELELDDLKNIRSLVRQLHEKFESLRYNMEQDSTSALDAIEESKRIKASIDIEFASKKQKADDTYKDMNKKNKQFLEYGKKHMHHGCVECPKTR